MDGPKPPSIFSPNLYGAIGMAVAPVVIDVRRRPGFAADNRMIVGAIRRKDITSTAFRLILFLATVCLFSARMALVRAEDTDPAALAAALKDAAATLRGGLKASEREGTPISAKFEIDDGGLQLSVYAIKGDDFLEVVADPKTGTVGKAEELTDAVDLNDAETQKAAMAKAKVTLLTTADTAVQANPGFQAVSIYPELQNGHPMAQVTLLQGTAF
jgi:hypothetical protein